MNTLTRLRRQLLSFRPHALYHLALDFSPANTSLHDEVHGETWARISADTIDTQAPLCAELLALNKGNKSYLDDVRKNHMQCVVILSNDQIVHYGFLYHKNRSAHLLGLPPDSALIGNSYTIPSFRGKGLQGRSVLLRASLAKSAGFTAIYAETSINNASSQRGLAKAGMRPLGRVDLIIIFRYLVIRWRRPTGFRTWDWCR